jgi:hypothetical protein
MPFFSTVGAMGGEIRSLIMGSGSLSVDTQAPCTPGTQVDATLLRWHSGVVRLCSLLQLGY